MSPLCASSHARAVRASRAVRGSQVFAVALLATGCVDTELGLDATVSAATTAVTGTEVRVTLDVDYRVGEHAEGARGFVPQAIELYLEGDLVAQLEPEVVGEHRATLSPGESASATLEGLAAGVTDAPRLCDAEVTVLFRWFDATTTEVGIVERVTSDVTCE